MPGLETPSDKIKWLKYVLPHDIEKYELHGWIVVAGGGPYSVIMEWVQEGDPVVPPKE